MPKVKADASRVQIKWNCPSAKKQAAAGVQHNASAPARSNPLHHHSTMGRKNHYDSLNDLYDELDNESILDSENILDDDDLALLTGPKATAPAKKRKSSPKKKPKAKRKK